jgi:hypothetical protein
MYSDKTTGAEKGVLIAYDLRDNEALLQAHRERRAWGRDHTHVHVLDRDHIVLAFRPGGALELSA